MEAVTKKPNVPALRFPEFSGEWQETRLGAISFPPEYGLNASAVEFDGVNGYLRITDIDGESGDFRLEKLSSPSDTANDSCVLESGDILLARTGASTGKSYLHVNRHQFRLHFAGFLIRFRLLQGYSPKFVQSCLLTDTFNNWVKLMSMRSGQPGINAREYGSFLLSVPRSEEQEKVAAFLTVVDERFGLLKRKKELLEEYKKGVMQRLFSREIRFKDEEGNEYPEWEEKRLGEVLFEHKDKSNGTEQVHSVSVHKGVINQIEHLGRSFAASNTDNYNRVYPGDIIYTKSPTGNFPFGIIKRNQKDEDVIVSPLYGVFTAESPGLAIWLDEFFSSEVNTHNYLSSIIQKGAKNTINITNRTFLTNSTLVPVDPNEQDRIGRLFGALNDKIQLMTSEIEALSNFKRGLLQKMFV
jgi:type I restriction enzyme S subunit